MRPRPYLRPVLSLAVDNGDLASPNAVAERDDATLSSAALRVALEIIPVPAAVVAANGTVRFANEAARRLEGGDRRAFSASVRASLDPLNPVPAFTLHPLEGAAGHYLAVLRASGPDPAPRALRWKRRLGLTTRQTEVLEHVVRGLANRTIAELLGCSEKTIELHVSAIFDKAGADSRASLVARFWTEG